MTSLKRVRICVREKKKKDKERGERERKGLRVCVRARVYVDAKGVNKKIM